MYQIFKRILDFIASLTTLVFLLPVFIPIMLILRVSGEGEVFYFQERYGLNNSRFQIWKFATAERFNESWNWEYYTQK